MKRRIGVSIAAGVAAVVLWAASASGTIVGPPDASLSSLFGGGPATDITLTRIPVRLAGQLTVQFHGDQDTGCAARGLCGTSGTLIWQPPRTGALESVTLSAHGRTVYNVSLGLFGQGLPTAPPVDGGVTTAEVRYAPRGSAGSPTICSDAAATGSVIEMPVNFRVASLMLAAATPSLLGTRCGGPLQSDLARLLPRRVVDVAMLAHGRTQVSLATSGEFAVRGLAGTVTSTLRLSLGRPQTQHVPSPFQSPTGFRVVQLKYRARMTGSLLVHAHGDPTSCAAVASCGAVGDYFFNMHSRPGTLEIEAVTRRHRPLRDVMTALGLRKGGNPRGIGATGRFSVAGSASEDVGVVRGTVPCNDAGPVGPMSVFLSIARGRISAGLSLAQPTLHLRCPGPQVAAGTTLASGTARVAALGRRGGTIHLRTGVELRDDGYRGGTVADLALTISRHPRVRVLNDALPSSSGG